MPLCTLPVHVCSIVAMKTAVYLVLWVMFPIVFAIPDIPQCTIEVQVPPRVVTTSADGAFSVVAADLDADGDMDLVSASELDNKIAWYENTDGAGAFGPQRIVTTLAVGARSVFAADLDGDGDMDLASASFADDKIAWYEDTDGTGVLNWSKR